MSKENGKGRLYEYAVLYHPRPKKDEDGNEEREPSEVIVDLERVVARTEQEVVIKASRSIPEEHMDHLEDVEIAVRPF